MNDSTNNGSTDPHHWFHYYQQSNSPANPAAFASGGTGFGFSETNSTIVTTSFTTNNTSSPNNSTSLGSGDVNVQLNAQGKPIRRRSRASRRTPTTLLNASTTNFRSLVQQFTGCHNTKASSFGSQKGPVNLSFGNQNDHQIIGTSSRIAPVGSEYMYNQQQMNPVVQQHQGQQWQQQEMYDNSQINNNNNNMQSGGLDDFAIDDVSDLHELMDESSSFSTGDNNRDDMSGNTDFRSANMQTLKDSEMLRYFSEENPSFFVTLPRDDRDLREMKLPDNFVNSLRQSIPSKVILVLANGHETYVNFKKSEQSLCHMKEFDIDCREMEIVDEPVQLPVNLEVDIHNNENMTFTHVMTASNVDNTSHGVYIPSYIESPNGQWIAADMVNLRTAAGSWYVGVVKSGKMFRLSSGWNQFVRDNEISLHETFVFQLLEEDQAVVFLVTFPHRP
ncbi:hypothetical protein AgCh_033327 [Apium graveolens]